MGVVAVMMLALATASITHLSRSVTSAAKQAGDERRVAALASGSGRSCHQLPSYAFSQHDGGLSFGYLFAVRLPAQIAAYSKRYAALGLTPPAHYDYFEHKIFSLGGYADFDIHVAKGDCAVIMVTGYEITKAHEAVMRRLTDSCRLGSINVYTIGRTCADIGVPRVPRPAS